MLAYAVLGVSLALTGLHIPFVLAAPGPATVVTPYGERQRSEVHVVPDGAGIHIVGEEAHIVDTTGHVLNAAPIGHAKPAPASRSASWHNHGTSPIEYFEASWTVPHVPTTHHGQTIFIFIGLSPASSSSVIAPVLQYGPSAAGGGSYWATAAWYVAGSTVYHTPLQVVSVGQTLRAVIEKPSQNGNLYNYFAAFVGIPGILPITNVPLFVIAQEALEAFNVKRSTDNVKGPIIFHKISLRTPSGIPSVHWTAHGPGVVVNVQGATNAKVTFN